MQSSSRVIVNTGIQYVRTFITVCIALYSSRIILQSLGVNDYGIYSLVGGIISLLSFINVSLASTTQRYLSFYQGNNDSEMQVKVFNNSLIIQIFAGLLLAIILYLLTPVIFGGFLNIPSGKISVATGVYYCMIVSVFFSMLSTPYLGTLIAHENILFTSIIQIVEAVLKLGIALSLLFIFYDHLIYYAIMMTGLFIIDFLAYRIYCHKKYDECKQFRLGQWDVRLLKEIFSFSGWMIYGTGCIVARTQGIAIILNRFFSTAINAAYGIAFQLQGQLNFISGSLVNAIKPQIMKAEGDSNRKKMLRLSEIASKFSFFLLAMIVVPAVFEMKAIIYVWLGQAPEYTVVFAQLVLITTLVDQLTIGLGYANQAVGNIKAYSLVVNTTKLLTLPAAYFCLAKGLSPVSVMVCMLVFEFICSISRLFFLNKTAGLLITPYVKKVFIPEIFPLVCSIVVCWMAHLLFPFYLFWLSFILSIGTLSTSVYLTGLCKDEKQIINELLLKIKRRSYVKSSH